MNHSIGQKNASQLVKNQKGHTVIEMSLLLLPFFLLIISVMEFGWYFLHQHTLQYATREGMRIALVGETLKDGQGAPLTREASIRKLIQEKAKVAAMDIGDSDIEFWTDPNATDNNYTGPLVWEDLAPNAGNPADYVRLKVQYQHKFLIPLFATFFAKSPGDDPTITLNAQATYRNELFDVGEV